MYQLHSAKIDHITVYTFFQTVKTKCYYQGVPEPVTTNDSSVFSLTVQ